LNYSGKIELKNMNTQLIINDKCVIGNRITLGSQCEKIEIGYGSFLGDDIYIDMPELFIGDYTTIHKGTTLHGYKKLQIGHNCWIGQSCVIDSIGGTTIGNNVGIGAYSQLWSHIKFGDKLAGCSWNSEKELIVEDDVWFVGHCIVSPIHAKKQSMLLVGGVITKDMEENHIYAGVPAKDITEKIGGQFQSKTTEEKISEFSKLYADFLQINCLNMNDYNIIIMDSTNAFDLSKWDTNNSVFFIEDRSYIPVRNNNEYKFMKYLLYDKAKFIPINNFI